MTERIKPTNTDADFDADDSRRSFLKKIGIITVGAAATAVAGKAAYEHGQNKEEAIVDELTGGPKKEIKVKSGDTIWGIYGESGYTDVVADYYVEAVKKLNPQITGTSLAENEVITVPWKSDKTSE